MKSCSCFRTPQEEGQRAGGDAKRWGWPGSGAEGDKEPAPGRDPRGKAEPGKSALMVQGVVTTFRGETACSVALPELLWL